MVYRLYTGLPRTFGLMVTLSTFLDSTKGQAQFIIGQDQLCPWCRNSLLLGFYGWELPLIVYVQCFTQWVFKAPDYSTTGGSRHVLFVVRCRLVNRVTDTCRTTIDMAPHQEWLLLSINLHVVMGSLLTGRRFSRSSDPWGGSRVTTAPTLTRRRPTPPSLCCNSASESCRDRRRGESSCSGSLSRWEWWLRKAVWPNHLSRSRLASRTLGQANAIAPSLWGSPVRGTQPTTTPRPAPWWTKMAAWARGLETPVGHPGRREGSRIILMSILLFICSLYIYLYIYIYIHSSDYY